MGRTDNRSIDEFKSHIKFTTEIESRVMGLWAASLNSDCQHYSDNGVDNNGEYVDDGVDTSNVDFIVTMKGETEKVELKFVPTAGKLTLKLSDIKNYIKQKASVLFIFNTGSETLKVPRNLDIESHWGRIVDAHSRGDLKWALVNYKTLAEMLDSTEAQKIPYMGGKMGIIVTEDRYNKFFKLMELTYDN